MEYCKEQTQKKKTIWTELNSIFVRIFNQAKKIILVEKFIKKAVTKKER